MNLDANKLRWIKDELQHLSDWMYINQEPANAVNALHELTWRAQEAIADVWQHLDGSLDQYGRIPYASTVKHPDAWVTTTEFKDVS